MGKLYKYSVDISYEYVELGCCGFATLLPADFIRARKNDHKSFYCPSCGESRYYPGKSDKERLEEQLAAVQRGKELAEARAERERNNAKAARRSARAHKGVATRLKNRAKAGVCPCCNRTFKQLAAHMKNKHPEYMADKK